MWECETVGALAACLLHHKHKLCSDQEKIWEWERQFDVTMDGNVTTIRGMLVATPHGA